MGGNWCFGAVIPTFPLLQLLSVLSMGAYERLDDAVLHTQYEYCYSTSAVRSSCASRSLVPRLIAINDSPHPTSPFSMTLSISSRNEYDCSTLDSTGEKYRRERAQRKTSHKGIWT